MKLLTDDSNPEKEAACVGINLGVVGDLPPPLHGDGAERAVVPHQGLPRSNTLLAGERASPRSLSP